MAIAEQTEDYIVYRVARLTDVQAANQFFETLASDHAARRKHQDSYEIPD